MRPARPKHPRRGPPNSLRGALPADGPGPVRDAASALADRADEGKFKHLTLAMECSARLAWLNAETLATETL